MPYPTNNAALVLEEIDRRMLSIKTRATARRQQMAAGAQPATAIIDLQVNLKAERAALVAAAATPGIATYAKQVKDNLLLDVVAEFQAVIAAIDAVTAWIESNFPADPSGYLLRETWTPSGPVDRNFTPAQTAGLRAALDALIATIN